MSGAVFIVAGQMSLKATWSSRPQPSNIGFTFDLKRGWFVIGVPDLSTGRRCSVTRFLRNGAMQFNALRSFIASSLHSAPALASLPPSALH